MLEQIATLFPALHDILGKGLLSNQFFVGTASAMAIGGGMYVARSLPVKIKNTFMRHTTTHINLRSDFCESFDDIAGFCNKHRVNWYGRNFALSWDAKLRPGYGASIVRWNNTWVYVRRSLMEKGIQARDQLDITFWTRRQSKVVEFIKQAKVRQSEEDMRIFISGGKYQEWRKTTKRKRRLETIFANGTTMEEIHDRISTFRKDEKWYEQRGIPYKFVGVLHGQPGTGKTSMVHALAGEFGYDIRSITSLDDLNLIPELDENAMVVIEDIDLLGKLNRDAKKTEKIDEEDEEGGETTKKRTSVAMHDLFNMLDGLATPHGLVVFITTNKIGDLDPALIRKGRVDMLLRIEYLDLDAMRKMFVAFFEDGGPALDRWVAANGANYKPMSGAELQEVFLTNRTVDGALDFLSKRCASSTIEIEVPELEPA